MCCINAQRLIIKNKRCINSIFVIISLRILKPAVSVKGSFEKIAVPRMVTRQLRLTSFDHLEKK